MVPIQRQFIYTLQSRICINYYIKPLFSSKFEGQVNLIFNSSNDIKWKIEK